MLSPPKLRRLRALPVPIDGAYGIQGQVINTRNDGIQIFEVDLPGRGIVRVIIDENNNFIIPDASHAIGNQKLLSNSGSTRSDYVQKYRGPT